MKTTLIRVSDFLSFDATETFRIGEVVVEESAIKF